MILIELPIHWETKQVIYFVNKLWSYIEEEEVLIDLTKVEFVRPFGVILIAESLRLFIEQRGIKGRKTHANIPRFETVNYNSASSYLMHVGFFHSYWCE